MLGFVQQSGKSGATVFIVDFNKVLQEGEFLWSGCKRP